MPLDQFVAYLVLVETTFFTLFSGETRKVEENKKCIFGTFLSPFFLGHFDYKTAEILKCLAKMQAANRSNAGKVFPLAFTGATPPCVSTSSGKNLVSHWKNEDPRSLAWFSLHVAEKARNEDQSFSCMSPLFALVATWGAKTTELACRIGRELCSKLVQHWLQAGQI